MTCLYVNMYKFVSLFTLIRFRVRARVRIKAYE